MGLVHHTVGSPHKVVKRNGTHNVVDVRMYLSAAGKLSINFQFLSSQQQCCERMCICKDMEITGVSPKRGKIRREMKKGRGKKSSSMVFLSICLVAGLFLVFVCPTLDPFIDAYRTSVSSATDICSGKRVYMYDLPPYFNVDLSNRSRCDRGLIFWMDLCPRFDNGGYGLNLRADSQLQSEDEFDLSNWYDTDSYMLEVIFHERMKQYRCLTEEPAVADAFFIPYYTGLQALALLYPMLLQNETRASKHLLEPRKNFGMELITWLEEQGGENLRRFGGIDHFIILGRTTWDFQFAEDWGTGFSGLPHVENMTRLMIERDTDYPSEQAIPYPTSFHPSSPERLSSWISDVRTAERKFLFSYVGGPRTDFWTVRGALVSQCVTAGESVCKLVNCSIVRCSHDPESIYKAFLQSNFCLQPRGDSLTRRSTFDCLISGSIPVFFTNDSAYNQYSWHLPHDHESYSVYISEYELCDKGVSIKEVLMGYSPDRISAMREKILSLIPSLIYNDYSTDPWSPSKDAFEVSVASVLNKIATLKNESSQIKMA